MSTEEFIANFKDEKSSEGARARKGVRLRSAEGYLVRMKGLELRTPHLSDAERDALVEDVQRAARSAQR